MIEAISISTNADDSSQVCSHEKMPIMEITVSTTQFFNNEET